MCFVKCMAIVLLSARCYAVVPIIPRPMSVTENPGQFEIFPKTTAPPHGWTQQDIYVDIESFGIGWALAQKLEASLGIPLHVTIDNSPGPVLNALKITTKKPPQLGPESYKLAITADYALISASDKAGLFYGVNSFLQLWPPQVLTGQPLNVTSYALPCVYILDKPRFPYRSIGLDVSRHFVDKAEIKKILEAMAQYKLNTFHWHLTDDHGWRIQINSYPNLTTTGAWRSGIDYGQNPLAGLPYNSSDQYGGFYTQDDVREIVNFATARHITIVPEIEMPAHMTAALLCYPNIACGQQASAFNMDSIDYVNSLMSLASLDAGTFMTNVLTEVVGLFPGHYIHCGGDEVWKTGDMHWKTYQPDKLQLKKLNIPTATQYSFTWKYPYQYWFSTNLVAFLGSKGRTMEAWSEIEAHLPIIGATVTEWSNTFEAITIAVPANQYAISMPEGHCYFNYYEIPRNENATKLEPYFNGPGTVTLDNIYSFDPVPSFLTPDQQKYILGSEGMLWTEYVPSARNVEYKLFPRAIAMAERLWSPKSITDFADFTTRLTAHVPRLAQLGLNYNHHFLGQDPPLIGELPSPAFLNANQTQPVDCDITSLVHSAGEIDISFVLNGNYYAEISNVQLWKDGASIASDNHTGTLRTNTFMQAVTPTLPYAVLPYYVLQLPSYTQGSTYSIHGTITAPYPTNAPDTTPLGEVHFVNWN